MEVGTGRDVGRTRGDLSWRVFEVSRFVLGWQCADDSQRGCTLGPRFVERLLSLTIAHTSKVLRALTQFTSSRSHSYGKAYISHDAEVRNQCDPCRFSFSPIALRSSAPSPASIISRLTSPISGGTLPCGRRTTGIGSRRQRRRKGRRLYETWSRR